jgi:hypothetical protein
MIEQGKALYKPVKICDVFVLDTKVIYHEAKGNWGRDVSE